MKLNVFVLLLQTRKRSKLNVHKIQAGQIATTLEVIFEGCTFGDIEVVIVLLNN
jgi:hypothetical protein